MKSQSKPLSPTAACGAQAFVLPTPTLARPVRRGGFWPGEHFAGCTRRLDLADVLAECGATLPVLAGSRVPRT